MPTVAFVPIRSSALPLALPVALLLARALPAQELAYIELAKAAKLVATDKEGAAAMVHRGLLLCDLVRDSKEQASLRSDLQKLQREIDRNGLRLTRAESQWVKDCRELAAAYAEAGWLATAERLLASASVVAPELVARQRAVVRNRIAEQEAAAPSPAVGNTLRDWFTNGAQPYSRRTWKCEGDALLTPPHAATLDGANTEMVLSTKRLPREGRLRLLVQLPKDCRIGVAFDVRAARKDDLQFHLLEFENAVDHGMIMAFYVGEGGMQKIDQRVEVPMDEGAFRGYVPVEIVMTEPVLFARLGHGATGLVMPRPRFGDDRLGLYVSANVDTRTPIRIRELVVEAFAPPR